MKFNFENFSISIALCMLSCFSHVQLSATLWTIAHQAPLSMDSPGKNTEWVAPSSSRASPDAGIKPASLASPVLTGGFFTTSAT